jgi:hypothetical protein
MKSLLMSLVILVSATSAFAADLGLEVGFRQQSGSTGLANHSSQSKTGYQVGFGGFFPMSDNFGIRSGLFYVSRPLGIETDSGLVKGTADVTLNYFEIPVAAAYQFEDYANLFAGVALSMNLDSSYSGTGTLGSGKVEEVKSVIVPIILGATFKFAPQLGATVFFETASGDVAKNLKDYKAVGASLVVTFE